MPFVEQKNGSSFSGSRMKVIETVIVEISCWANTAGRSVYMGLRFCHVPLLRDGQIAANPSVFARLAEKWLRVSLEKPARLLTNSCGVTTSFPITRILLKKVLIRRNNLVQEWTVQELHTRKSVATEARPYIRPSQLARIDADEVQTLI